MPDPANYSSEDEWMEACVSTMIDEGKPQDQAVAACMGMWHDKAVQVTVQNLSSVLAKHGLPKPELIQRAWSVLTVKGINDEKREIEGIASTPSVDRIGDIIEPLGAKFTLPMPLLHHHRHDQPVGHVISAKATKAGITIKAVFAKVTEPGKLKERIDLAWQEIKAGLVRGLSIGFSPIDFEPLDVKNPFGGLRFTAWNWHELSLVTIPANIDAQISIVKSLDQELQAASGQAEPRSITPGDPGPVRLDSKPRAGATANTVNLKRKEREKMPTTITEHIGALEAKRASNTARMEAIMAKAMEDGRSTAADEQEEFDTLEGEVTRIDDDLKRFRRLEQTNVQSAQPVQQVRSMEDGTRARAGMIRLQAPDMPPGLRMARVAKCLAVAQGNRVEALAIAKRLYPSDLPTIGTLDAAVQYGEVSDLAVKAAVPAGSTTDAQWAGALVSAVSGESGVVGDFLEFIRPMTIVGKFGTGGIPSLRRVPFRTGLITQHTGGTGYWVGEGAPKPVMKVDLSRRTLLPTKCAAIAVVTDELLRDSSPSADTLVRDSLTGAIVELIDSDFIDPASTASGARPASITNGVTSIIASGGGAYGSSENIKLDVRLMMNNFVTAGLTPNVWIMRNTTALALSMMQNPLGQPEFAGMGVNGGTFVGMPVITSQHVPAAGSPSGDYVILLDTNCIWFADEGGMAIDMSREATLEMDDAPTGAAFTGSPGSVTPLGTASHVSLWQQNLTGWRIERTLNWTRARAGGVQVLEGANWGEGTEP